MEAGGGVGLSGGSSGQEDLQISSCSPRPCLGQLAAPVPIGETFRNDGGVEEQFPC